MDDDTKKSAVDSSDDMELPDILKKDFPRSDNSDNAMETRKDPVDLTGEQPGNEPEKTDSVAEKSESGPDEGIPETTPSTPETEEVPEPAEDESQEAEDAEIVDGEKQEEEPQENENTSKETKHHGKLLVILLLCILAILLLLFGVFKYLNGKSATSTNSATSDNENSVQDALLTVTNATVPYDASGKPVDPTTLVSTNAGKVKKLTADPSTIDPSKIGDQPVTFTVTTSEGSQDIQETFTVADLTGPVITFNEPSVNVALNASFDSKSNIKSVVDNMDGDLQETDNDTTPGFKIESNVQTGKTGTYTVTVNATDTAGNQSQQKYTVVVDGGTATQPAAAAVEEKENNQKPVAVNKSTPKPATDKATTIQRQPQRNVTPQVDSKAENAATKSVTDMTKSNDTPVINPAATVAPSTAPETRIWTCTADGQSFTNAGDAARHASQTGHKITSYTQH